MKKETIYRHEINESIAADAAMSCLKNRNKPQQMNEAVPVVAGLIRLAMPLLRPIITKLVRGMIMKAGAKLTGKQVAKMVIKNVSNGKTLMKIGKKVGQTWTELPAELKQEITKTAINTFNELRTKKSETQIATQEQEEETSAFDERFAYRKDLRNMANDVTKKAYMIIRKEFGDSMWRRLHMDDCDERGLISQMNDYQKYYNITNPQDIADCMLGRKSVRSFKKSSEEQEEVKNVREKLPVQYEEYVLPDIVDMVSDKGISEEEVIARLLTTPELPWEYDEIEDWVAEEFKGEGFNLTEAVEQIINDNMNELKKMDFSQKEDFVFAAICKATNKNRKDMDLYEQDSYDEIITSCLERTFGIDEEEEMTLSESELEDLAFRLADYLTESFIVLEDEDEDYSNLIEAIEKILKKDVPNPNSKKDCYAWCKRWYQKIEDLSYSYNNYPNPESYYTDEEEEGAEDYNNIQSKLADAWDEGIDDDVFDPYDNKFDKTYDDVVWKLISAVWHYFEDEADVEGFNIFKCTENQIGKAIEQILDKHDDMPSSRDFKKCYSWVKKHAEEIIKVLETGSLENTYEGHPEFDFNEQEEMPSMERRDMILALAEYMSESWIDTGDDGDLDDIYYAVANILDETGDYPQSTSWKDCKPWCQKYYKQVESKIYSEEE